MTGIAAPPGRAGRLWLERRLAVARRGEDVLDRKLRVLQLALAGARERAARTGEEWDAGAAEAQRWLTRTVLLGGQRALRLAAGRELAEVAISEAVTAGVPHPEAATCTVPEGAWAILAPAGAQRAYAAALRAAVRHAAASEALRVLAAETEATRYRLRAIRDRWIPRLEEAAAEVALALDELERADAARLAMSQSTRGGPAPGNVAHDRG